jgi:hypothetical protein
MIYWATSHIALNRKSYPACPCFMVFVELFSLLNNFRPVYTKCTKSSLELRQRSFPKSMWLPQTRSIRMFCDGTPSSCPQKGICVDNGKKLTARAVLVIKPGAKVYFAHPYPSSKRDLSKRAILFMRYYLPKNQSLQDLKPKKLAKIIARINNRHRESPGDRTLRSICLNQPIALRTLASLV